MSVCRAARKQGCATPILMLTALDSVDDKISTTMRTFTKYFAAMACATTLFGVVVHAVKSGQDLAWDPV